jgi:hypothetical protein
VSEPIRPRDSGMSEACWLTLQMASVGSSAVEIVQHLKWTFGYSSEVISAAFLEANPYQQASPP